MDKSTRDRLRSIAKMARSLRDQIDHVLTWTPDLTNEQRAWLTNACNNADLAYSTIRQYVGTDA